MPATMDPFQVGTISDSDDVPDYDEVDSNESDADDAAPNDGIYGDADEAAAEPVKPPAAKKAKTDAKKKGNNDGFELNADFLFDPSGHAAKRTRNGDVDSAYAWDFGAAKASLKNTVREKMRAQFTTLDDKIAAQREKLGADADGADADGSDADTESGDSDDASATKPQNAADEVALQTRAMSSAERKRMRDELEESPEDVLRQKKAAAYFAPEPTQPEKEDGDDETFAGMNLSRPIMKGLTTLGFIKPTPIQCRAIPLGMAGKDLCGAAVTGSGKTAAFLIPILERLLYRPKNSAVIRVLILVPTRELGVQVHSVAERLAQYTDITATLCVGGLSNKAQEAELRRRPDMVIATPGRLIDHVLNTHSFSLSDIEILIMDEADRMLEAGFTDELNQIVQMCPKSRQTMLFSATMTDNVDELIRLSLNKPIRLFVDAPTDMAGRLKQEFIRVRQGRGDQKPAILVSLCTRTFTQRTIIFFRQKWAAHRMKVIFGLLGLKAAELHGNLTQLQRLEALEEFRDSRVDFLMATDLAARGIDIAGIQTVINYELPASYEQYLHRCGRTARAGASGCAVSLVEESDRQILKMALKNATSDIKNRVVAPEVIVKIKKRLDGLTEAIEAIFEEEKADKALRQASMEVLKAENIIEHKDEILSRPKREWFQSEKDKENARLIADKTKAAMNETVAAPKKQPKQQKLNRRQRRRKEAMIEDKKIMSKVNSDIRAAKRSTKGQRLTQFAAPKDPAAAAKKPGKGGKVGGAKGGPKSRARGSASSAFATEKRLR